MDLQVGDYVSPVQTRNQTILVVDDEETLCSTLEYNLRREGYHVLTANTGMDAVRLAAACRPDMIILDIMLPGMNGFDVCRAVRKHSTMPILMLSAREDEIDKVLGLELGADDYLTKPFGLRELLARVHAMLRRAEIALPEAAASPGLGSLAASGKAESAHKMVAGDLVMDLLSRTVIRSGTSIDLKPKEFDLLTFLASSPMHVFSRDVLLDRVWGYDFVGGTRTVDVHVRWLRLKLETDPANPRLIQTIFGVGYKFGHPVTVKRVV